MGDATEEYFLSVLEESQGIVDSSGAEHLMIGSLAQAALVSSPWTTADDIDILVPPTEVDRILELFEEKGFSVSKKWDSTLFKAARPNVTVDIFFRTLTDIEMDDEMIRRARSAQLNGVSFMTPCPEDLAWMAALAVTEDHPQRWYTAVKLLGRFPIDWSYLQIRGAQRGTNRIRSLMLFAESVGVDVPGEYLGK